MKNYLKNKDFIPKKYVRNVDNKKDQGNRRGIIYLVIINLFMLPITIGGILEKGNEENSKISEVIIEESISKESIIGWINEVDKDIEELVVNDNIGIMTIKDINKIYSLENNEEIFINNIIQNEKGDYIIEVARVE